NAEDRRRLRNASGQLVGRDQLIGLIDFTSQSDQEAIEHVGVIGDSSKRAAKVSSIEAGSAHAAAGLMRNCKHAVDVGERRKNFCSEMCGDPSNDSGGTIHRSDDGEIVSRSNSPVG